MAYSALYTGLFFVKNCSYDSSLQEHATSSLLKMMPSTIAANLCHRTVKITRRIYVAGWALEIEIPKQGHHPCLNYKYLIQTYTMIRSQDCFSLLAEREKRPVEVSKTEI
jgi:hypothetical protein